MDAINSWLEHWEPLWLFLVLTAELLVGLLMVYWMRREFYYDAQKDQTKRKRTKVVVDNVEGSNVDNKRKGEDTCGEETTGC